jgi:hypothetical protein
LGLFFCPAANQEGGISGASVSSTSLIKKKALLNWNKIKKTVLRLKKNKNKLLSQALLPWD